MYIYNICHYLYIPRNNFIYSFNRSARPTPSATRRPFPLFNTRVNVYSRTTGSVCRGRCRERARERSHPFVPSRFRDFPRGKRQAIDGARTFAVVYFFFLNKKKRKKEYYRQLFWNPRFACKSYATTVKLPRANYNRYFPTLDALHESDRDLDYFWTALRPQVGIIRHSSFEIGHGWDTGDRVMKIDDTKMRNRRRARSRFDVTRGSREMCGRKHVIKDGQFYLH